MRNSEDGVPRSEIPWSEERRVVAHPHAGGVAVASRVVRDYRGVVRAFKASLLVRGEPIAVAAALAGVRLCDVIGHVQIHGAVGCPACGALA